MKIRTAFCCIALGLAAVARGSTRSPVESVAPQNLADKPFLTLPGDQWKLLWNDEFNGDHLDPTKWTSGLTWPGDDASYRHHNSEYASYITDDNIRLHDGNLELLTQKQDVANPNAKVYHYTQAFIQTSGKFEYTFGYCEVRVKVPTESGPGLWPAFWMLSRGWPPEDDVAEFWTGRPLPHTHQGYAYRSSSGKVEWDSNHKNSILDGFHTFGMEWGPGYQLFNRDGVITNSSFGSRVTGLPMYLILNSGVTSRPAPTAKTVFPNAFLVDYVRVYSRPSVLAVLNTGFESDSLAPWTPWNGASIVQLNPHTGKHALQLPSPSSGTQQNIFGLKPNTTYRLSAWVDSISQGEARIGIKNVGSAEKSASTTAAGYNEISLNFTTGPSEKNATIYCYKISGDAPAFFDDITVTQITGNDLSH